MKSFLSDLTSLATSTGVKILLSLIVFFLGKFFIKKALKLLKKSKLLSKADRTVQTFTLSFIKIGLYILLTISIIGIMGVPMASVVTVLASAGVAVGLALQGALSNLAGGIMLMIFKPFKQDDYISAAGVEGVVKGVTIFYTVIMTLDNKRITVPNGTLMNANVTNYSSEALRRVDLKFTCARSESPAKIQEMMLNVIKADDRVLSSPEPFARISGASSDSMEFTVRTWCKGEDYWDIYYDLTQKITETMAANNVQAPAVRVITAEQK